MDILIVVIVGDWGSWRPGGLGHKLLTFLFRLLMCSVTVGKCAQSLPRGSMIAVRYGAS